MDLLVFPAASTVLLIRYWARWLGFVAVVLGMPALAVLRPGGTCCPYDTS